jgi:regulator of protease activity HflC (stomatin/prohibitin superfamily)
MQCAFKSDPIQVTLYRRVRMDEGPFGMLGGDFWPLTDDCGATSVCGRRQYWNAAGERIEVVAVGHVAIILAVSGSVVLVMLAIASIRVVQQYQRGVHFRLGRVIGVDEPGLRLIIPFIDRLWRVSMRIVTMPIQSQGIITRDNVSVDIAAVAYFRVTDAQKSVVVIENVNSAINQIAQTTLRNVVGQHSLDEVLAQTEKINGSIRQILDITTVGWGVEVTLVELKDIQLPDSMKRAMAREAEAEREKRAKIIAAEGEARAAAALGDASDIMMKHPLALQLRNLQTLAELGVEKNTTVVFPAPLMSAIGELTGFLNRESNASRSTKPNGLHDESLVHAATLR